MKRTLSGLIMECKIGDIAAQNGFDAIVNAANAWLRPGGGVAGAIHSAAGPGLLEECRPLAPIKPGEAVITGAYHLPNKYVIHCLGPVYEKDEFSSKVLANCYCNALKLAEEYKVKSIAFPLISTGVFGYPFKEGVHVAFTALKEMIPRLTFVRRVMFVVRDKNKLALLNQELALFHF